MYPFQSYQQPFQQQFQPQYQTQTPSYNQIKQEIVRVNGANGARAYQIAPNSSVLLLDEQKPIVWLKTTDGAGYATETPYTITPYQQEEQFADYKTLEARISKLEEEISNGKSNTKRNESDAKDK